MTAEESNRLRVSHLQTSEEFLKSMQDNEEWLEFWRTLRRLRIRAGMSQTELAALTGVNQVYISKLECGHVNPTIKTVFKIAGVLNSRMMLTLK